MMIGGVALMLVAGGLLTAGLIGHNDPMLYGSISASAISALALIVAMRRPAVARDPSAAPVTGAAADSGPTGPADRPRTAQTGTDRPHPGSPARTRRGRHNRGERG